MNECLEQKPQRAGCPLKEHGQCGQKEPNSVVTFEEFNAEFAPEMNMPSNQYMTVNQKIQIFRTTCRRFDSLDLYATNVINAIH